MATDRELRRMNLAGMSVNEIRDALGHSADSVRGRIHRASLQDRLVLARELATKVSTVNVGVERQKEIIRRGEDAFATRQQILRENGDLVKAVFISDLHLPYTRWSALYLATLIIRHINPSYISAANDFYDFENYGRWKNIQTPAQMLWTQDIENGYALGDEIYATLRKAAPNADLLQLQGNHDNWLYNYVRTEGVNGFSEGNLADFMERQEAAGVLHFNRGLDKKENVIELSPGLKWVHGVSAAANANQAAAATSNKLAGRGELAGIFYDTVGGHSHRAGVYKVNGRVHYNSGTFMEDDPRYCKHRPFWDLAFVVSTFDPNSRYHKGELIEIVERGGNFVARYDGIDFDVPIEME